MYDYITRLIEEVQVYKLHTDALYFGIGVSVLMIILTAIIGVADDEDGRNRPTNEN